MSLPQNQAPTLDRVHYIQIDDVAFIYPGTDAPVLDGATLHADQGTVTCLMGVNGCGKSTLIDCILGENRISSGTILVDGEDAMTMGPTMLAHRISYVPQVHNRTFPYRVRDVVLMGRTAYRGIFSSPSEQDHAIVEKAMKDCGIAHLSERSYTQLSGGETQMVLLARALAQQAPFIIMDEPTAHLDFRNELFFLETVVRLVRDQNVGVLMATHSPNQAFYFEGNGVPTTCVLMEGGKARFAGAPTEVLTSDNLRGLYGVQAQVIEARIDDSRTFSQLLLVETEDVRHE